MCSRLGLVREDLEELYRRAVFNILGVNHDDHTKSFGFLMDSRGQWRLAPAFDLTCACDPSGRWTAVHQTALSGKTSGHNLEDLIEFAWHCSLSLRDARMIISRVKDAFGRWPVLARKCSVPGSTAEIISVMQKSGSENMKEKETSSSGFPASVLFLSAGSVWRSRSFCTRWN